MKQTCIKWKGRAIPISQTTLKKFGLKSGHEVKTEKDFLNIITGKFKNGSKRIKTTAVK